MNKQSDVVSGKISTLTQNGGRVRSDAHGCACRCFIIPHDVLERFAKDKKLSTEERKTFADTLQFEKEWRKVRNAHSKLARLAKKILPSGLSAAAAAAPPVITVFNCAHGNTLPGTPLANPGSSSDATAKRAFVETSAVADFYQQLFGRNSVDNAGKTLLSSIHYSVDYNNAFWNGSQMTYGDGDGNIFIDFTKANDVIAHELTHGVTQYSAGLSYTNQAGGLNESISDVFGSMFRQWRANQAVTQADWLIGKDIMGPGAIARGFTCLRDMAKPAAKHCLSPQPTKFSQYHNGMDPHYSSGIPNLAFYKAAVAIGGKSWEKAGQIWYQALTDFAPNPNMKMSVFAKRTRAGGQPVSSRTRRENRGGQGLDRSGSIKSEADEMAKLHVERIGGLAGFGGVGAHIRSHGEIDTAALSDAEQQKVEALFQSHGKAQPSQVCDGFRYRVSRTTPNGVETIETHEGVLPAPVSQCVKDEFV